MVAWDYVPLAAVFFDRVWSLPDHPGTFLGLQEEVKRIICGDNHLDGPVLAKVPKEWNRWWWLARAYEARFGCQVVLGPGTVPSFREGLTLGYSATLTNILVPYGQPSWEQVLEFRRDRQTLEKARRLRLWFADGLKARSEAEAVERIVDRISDYEAALSKHAIQTRLGVYRILVDYRTLFTSGAVAAVGVASGGLSMAALAAAGVIAASVGIHFEETRLGRLELERTEPVALVADVAKELR